MGKETAIPWCDDTFNVWRGCQRVSPGCEHCYAEELSHYRPDMFGRWGNEKNGGTRVVAAPARWKELHVWNRQAAKTGVRRKVFCASLADWLEAWRGPVLDAFKRPIWTNLKGEWHAYPVGTNPPPGHGYRPLTVADMRLKLLATIDATPWIDYLLLTKRPEGFHSRMTETIEAAVGMDTDDARIGRQVAIDWLNEKPPENVWFGFTAENQAYYDLRAVEACGVPARVRFCSYEPALGPINFHMCNAPKLEGKRVFDPVCAVCADNVNGMFLQLPEHAIHWVIVGGESGAEARPFSMTWARGTVKQLENTDVSVFVKQMGRRPVPDASLCYVREDMEYARNASRDVKQGEKDYDLWPDDLRVRQFPIRITVKGVPDAV